MPAVPEQANPAALNYRSVAAGRERQCSSRWLCMWFERIGVLWMNTPVLVQIIGAPIACSDGVKDAWREVAGWAAQQLKTRFGESVRVEYFDLFEADCPPIPSGAQLPLVLVNGQVLSSGAKVSVPLIRKHVEELKIGTPT